MGIDPFIHFMGCLGGISDTIRREEKDPRARGKRNIRIIPPLIVDEQNMVVIDAEGVHQPYVDIAIYDAELSLTGKRGQMEAPTMQETPDYLRNCVIRLELSVKELERLLQMAHAATKHATVRPRGFLAKLRQCFSRA